jgi:hypothetical protein
MMAAGQNANLVVLWAFFEITRTCVLVEGEVRFRLIGREDYAFGYLGKLVKNPMSSWGTS